MKNKLINSEQETRRTRELFLLRGNPSRGIFRSLPVSEYQEGLEIAEFHSRGQLKWHVFHSRGQLKLHVLYFNPPRRHARDTRGRIIQP